MDFRMILVLGCDCQGFNINHEQIAGGFRNKQISLGKTGDVHFREKIIAKFFAKTDVVDKLLRKFSRKLAL